ncbi:MAG: hypothetical protein QOF51_2754 [Chloroflexota bacterium]|jgi:hypothetical protein|nr:hypothetical protein [Chloroflexota bacterium]
MYQGRRRRLCSQLGPSPSGLVNPAVSQDPRRAVILSPSTPKTVTKKMRTGVQPRELGPWACSYCFAL